MNRDRFTDRLWNAGRTLLVRMQSHPFNQDLAQGTLPVSAFSHYLQQDEHYIRDYTSALQVLGERVDNNHLRRDLDMYARDGLALEQAMHQVFFSRFRIKPAVQKTPACSIYGAFLLENTRNASVAVALAALLPCFWFYWEVGQSILARAIDDNPYQPWIDTYSGAEFQHQVESLLAHINAQASQVDDDEKKLMLDAFVTSALLELAFWDCAYLDGHAAV